MVAVKMVVVCLVVGLPTALAGWAAVDAYRRFRVAERAVAGSSGVSGSGGVPGSAHTIGDVGENSASSALSATAGMADRADAAPAVDDWECVGLSAPVEVSVRDREYYRSCWRHILGTFAHWPTVGLDLAGHLTVNLMLNRGIVPDDTNLSNDLPADWQFPTAQGFREAQNIARRAAQGEQLSREELSKGLMLYRALFEEILEIPTSADSMR